MGLDFSKTEPPSPAPPMPLYGYARVSTIDQDLAVQRAALKVAGCDIIRAEKASGARRDGRSELHRYCSTSCAMATPWWSPASIAWPGR